MGRPTVMNCKLTPCVASECLVYAPAIMLSAIRHMISAVATSARGGAAFAKI